MSQRPRPLAHALGWAELWPSLRSGLVVLALLALAVVVVREYAAPIRQAIAAHGGWGLAVFIATSALAVLLPLLTNLPLLPVAVLAWGPWWTAVSLLAGWTAGAALSFWLGRHARDTILRHLPSVRRHADIDRLIHPQRRLLSLVLLRMTFPVDVLSYALGLFSRRTTLAEVVWSTVLGAAPFALLFAWVPALSAGLQIGVLVASSGLFVLYARWVLGRSGEA